MEVSGQADAIRPGALDTDLDDRTKPGEPLGEPPVAGLVDRERLDPQHGSVLIERRCDMHIGMRVHTTNHTGYHRHDCPFLSLTGGRGGTRHRDGGPRPTELVVSVQPDPHRPTGACNTTLIIANQHTQPDTGGGIRPRQPVPVGYAATPTATCLVSTDSAPR